MYMTSKELVAACKMAEGRGGVGAGVGWGGVEEDVLL